MSRSKKNWDHLVLSDGTYGINVQEGVYPNLDGQLKGQKGKQGAVGQKGQKGQKGYGGTKGDQGRIGFKGDKGVKGEPIVFDDLTAGQQQLIKGEKGEIGNTGQKGDEGLAPILTFKGSVASMANLPSGAAIGDTYFVDNEDEHFAWGGTHWYSVGNAIKGEKGDRGPEGVKGGEGEKGNKGDEGEKGDTGEKGDIGSTGADGLNAYELAVIDGFSGSQQDWLESLKGEPGSGGGGTTGDVFDETEYYNKSDIDTKIAGHQSIEKAFNYFFHGNTPNNILQSETVNFNDTDRFKSLYDSGCVLLRAGNTLTGDIPPFRTAQEILLVNTVSYDPSGSRSSSYEVIQQAWAAEGDEQFLGYVRRVQPGQNYFGSWQALSFDADNYYTKTETNLLINNSGASKTYSLRVNSNPGLNTEKITLREDGTTVDSDIILEGESGISIRRDGADKLVISADGLNGINYIGPISPGQDPSVRAPSAEKGDFFIYSSAGTAWNGDQIGTGDWVIYAGPGALDWDHVFVGGESGVNSVEVLPGRLLQSGTLNNVVLELDEDNIVSPAELTETLADYSRWNDIASFARIRTLGSLADVSVGNHILGAGNSYQDPISLIGPAPMTQGQYHIDPVAQVLTLSQNDRFGVNGDNFYNAVGTTFVRVVNTDFKFDEIDEVVEKEFNGLNYVYTFKNPLICRQLQSFPGPFNINVLEDFDTPDGAVLKYDEGTRLWTAQPEAGALPPDTIDQLDARYVVVDKPGEQSIQRKKLVFELASEETGLFQAEVRGTLTLTDALYAEGAVFTDTVTHSGAIYDKGYWTQDLNDPTTPRRGLSEDPGKWLDNEYIPWKQIKIVREQLITDIDNLSSLYFKKDGSEPFASTFTLLTDVGTSTIRTPNEVGSILQFNVGNKIDGSETPVLILQDGSINLVGNRLINLPDPVYEQDAATRGWVESLQSDGEIAFDPNGAKTLKGTGPMTFQKEGFFVLRPQDGLPLINAQRNQVIITNPQGVGGYVPQFDQDLVTKIELDKVLAVAESKVEEVAFDNRQYVRSNGVWQEVDLSNVGGGNDGIEEAPSTDKIYCRDGKRQRWVEAPDSTAIPSSETVSTLPNNPVRGKIYITTGNVVAIGL